MDEKKQKTRKPAAGRISQDELGRAKAKITQLEARLRNREIVIKQGISRSIGLVKRVEVENPSAVQVIRAFQAAFIKKYSVSPGKDLASYNNFIVNDVLADPAPFLEGGKVRVSRLEKESCKRLGRKKAKVDIEIGPIYADEGVNVHELVQNAVLLAFDRDDAQSKARHLQEKNDGLVRRLKEAEAKGAPAVKLVLKNANFKPKTRGPIITGEDAKTEWGKNINDFYARFVAAFSDAEARPEQKPAEPKKAEPKPKDKPAAKKEPEKKSVAPEKEKAGLEPKEKPPEAAKAELEKKKPVEKPEKTDKKPEVPKPEPKEVTYDSILSQFKDQSIASLAAYGVSEADIEKAINEEFNPRQKLYFRKGRFDVALAIAYLARTHGLPEDVESIEIRLSYTVGSSEEGSKPAGKETGKKTGSIDDAVEVIRILPDEKDSDEAFYAAYAAVVAVDKNPDADASEKEAVYLNFLAYAVSADYRCGAEVYNNLGCLQMNEYGDYGSAKKSFARAVECAEEDVKENPGSQDAGDRLAKYQRNLKACRHNIAVLTVPTA